MKVLYLSLGSNIKPRLQHLVNAIILLEKQFGAVIKYSNIYESASWGNNKLNTFYNLVLQLQSDKKPLQILEITQNIEKKLGRNHKEHWQNRTIDVDIIFFGDSILESKKLTIPHKLMHLRKFVLLPIADLNENFIHPILQKPIKELILQCKDELEIKQKVF